MSETASDLEGQEGQEGAGEGQEGQQGQQGQEGQEGTAAGEGQGSEQGKQSSEKATALEKETGQEGKGQSWRDFVSDDLKAEAEQYETPDQLLKRAKGLREKLSTAIVPPGEDASDEEKAEYRQKMGIPESPDDYKVEKPEDLPEPLQSEMQKERENRIIKKAHELNLSNEQLQGLLAENWEIGKEELENLKQENDRFVQETTNALKREWGQDYDRNIQFANNALNFAVDGEQDRLDELLQLKTDTGQYLLDDARVSRVFARIGRALGEDNLGPALTTEMTESLEQRLETLEEDKQKAIREGKSHDWQKKYGAELDAIYEKLYPGGTEVPSADS